jgi:hypothetical protein
MVNSENVPEYGRSETSMDFIFTGGGIFQIDDTKWVIISS